MRMSFALLAFLACIGVVASQAHADQGSKRIRLKVTFADGSAVGITQVEGDTAEVNRQGSNPLHLGLIPTYAKTLVTVQVVDLERPDQSPLAKLTGPIGEPMEVWVGSKMVGPPTLRITPEKVY